jgi:hypothetical protein
MYDSLVDSDEDPDTINFDSLYETWQEQASGTVSEWAYAGTSFTFFPLHLEDAYMPSANILAAGDSKVWIFLPQDSLSKALDILSG